MDKEQRQRVKAQNSKIEKSQKGQGYTIHKITTDGMKKHRPSGWPPAMALNGNPPCR
jgi:hypothetical protein